jgi:hypothetical protein
LCLLLLSALLTAGSYAVALQSWIYAESQSAEVWRIDGINHLAVQSPAANGNRQANEMSD